MQLRASDATSEFAEPLLESKQSMSLCPGYSDIYLFRYCQRVILVETQPVRHTW